MACASFPDHFSATASEYARFRPRYPAALYDWLLSQVPACAVAWDCATGTGQAALAIVDRVPLVVASDASVAQLRAATSNPRVHYFAATAEHVSLRDGSVDLITVAQAMHWFDADAFSREALRVLAPGGLLAVWSYGDVTLGASLDAAVAPVMAGLRPHWPPERAHIVAGYRTLPFPVREIEAPTFWLEQEWSREQLLGYAGTWSAREPYRAATGRDVVADLRDVLASHWPADGVRQVRWPLVVRAGRNERVRRANA